jgi:ABC-2 type transport system permease protein
VSPKKIALIATREFVASAGNKGFLIGLLLMPALLGVAVVLTPRIINSRSPQVRGDVAVVDPTGQVTARLRTMLDPANVRSRREANVRRTLAATVPAAQADSAVAASQSVLAQVPELRILERPGDTDLAQQKAWLLGGGNGGRPLAVIVVHPQAVTRSAADGEFGSYDLYVSSTLDDPTEAAIAEGVREALVDARLATSNLDRAAIDATMRVQRPQSVIVSAAGEQRSQRAFTRALPFALGIVLFIAIVVGGQALMTSTIEEKSSRVVEVLLAAISPFELMAGKLLGQLGVGLLVMAVYLSLGVLALFQFAMFGLVDPMLAVYAILFFLISYLVFGALMMSIGAAVNSTAEAQSLMAPVMILLLAPYILSPAIGRAPNSTFSIVASFVPPVNTFVMMARLASDSPPPVWQVLLTVLVGLGAAAAAVWFAAKVFKIGLLMHGKPPTFATFVRWAREA